MAPAWLLAALVFLCLRPGGDAITCHRCMVKSSSEKCSETCTVNNGSCLTATATAEKVPSRTIITGKGCVPKNYAHCGQTRQNVRLRLLVSSTCCDKSDFCNS